LPVYKKIPTSARLEDDLQRSLDTRCDSIIVVGCSMSTTENLILGIVGSLQFNLGSDLKLYLVLRSHDENFSVIDKVRLVENRFKVSVVPVLVNKCWSELFENI
jgi:hypothetical protein